MLTIRKGKDHCQNLVALTGTAVRGYIGSDCCSHAGCDCGRPFGGDGYVHTLVSAEHRQWTIAGLPDDAFEQLLVGTFQILLNQLSEEELLGCRLHAN